MIYLPTLADLINLGLVCGGPALATLLVPNVGELRFLNFILNKVAQENQTIKLYSNNITPSQTDTDATYTEVTGGGYVSKSLVAANWTVSGGNPGTATHTQQTWTFTGAVSGGLVYGYYIVGASSGTLLWAERFSDGPYPISFVNDQILITPKLNLQ